MSDFLWAVEFKPVGDPWQLWGMYLSRSEARLHGKLARAACGTSRVVKFVRAES